MIIQKLVRLLLTGLNRIQNIKFVLKSTKVEIPPQGLGIGLCEEAKADNSY